MIIIINDICQMVGGVLIVFVVMVSVDRTSMVCSPPEEGDIMELVIEGKGHFEILLTVDTGLIMNHNYIAGCYNFSQLI